MAHTGGNEAEGALEPLRFALKAATSPALIQTLPALVVIFVASRVVWPNLSA